MVLVGLVSEELVIFVAQVHTSLSQSVGLEGEFVVAVDLKVLVEFYLLLEVR